jgi:hypothetical protein
MPKCTDETVKFGCVGRRVVEAAVDGGDIVSDGGVLLLKQLDERLGLSRAAALAFGDERRSASVQHSMHSLLAQRIYGLCLGWSDVCDHNVLRNDPVMQTAVGRAEALASAPTLSRLETGATAAHAGALHEVLMQQFIAGHVKAPKELVLDVDAIHVLLHCEQERGHFHAYYDNYCYPPLCVFASFDFDNDRALKHLLIGQSLHSESPFEVTDGSLLEAAPERGWQAKARAAIKRADLVIVLVGRQTHRAAGVLQEIEMARLERKPIVQLIGRRNDNYRRVANAGRLIAWTWPNLKKLLAS